VLGLIKEVVKREISKIEHWKRGKCEKYCRFIWYKRIRREI
jgi:hypothetical protein